MHADSFLIDVLVFLLATVIAVPLFNRFRLGSVLGYLAAGALIGPHGFDFVQATHGELEVAELGVVMLLFIIGLELSPARLWTMRRALFGVGALQVGTTAIALGLAGVAMGLAIRSSVVLGLALALSSTAFVIQLLAERKELGTPYGRTALAILLFQDLIALPLIAFVPVLGEAQSSTGMDPATIAIGIAKALAAIAAVIVVGRYILPTVFGAVARARSTEAFMAVTLLVVLGVGWAISTAGISMALGAFLAGMVLAESEYRHEIESHIEPFKGLLLGLFFMSVGMSVDWSVIADHWVKVALFAFALLALKFALLYPIGRYAARLAPGQSLFLSASMSQGGEFAFVILALALKGHLITNAQSDLVTAVIVLSMAATPLMLMVADRIERSRKVPEVPWDEIIDEQPPRVIIAGFGRMGQIVARVLRAQRISFTALENSYDQVMMSRRFGNKIYFGDPARPELLRAARADQAEILVITTDSEESTIQIAKMVKRHYPHLKIYSRARNRQHAFKLMDLGLTGIERETFHSSLVLARRILEKLGIEPAVATQKVDRFRRHDEAVLWAQHQVHTDEDAVIRSSKASISELERLFDADDKKALAEKQAESKPNQPV